MNLNMTPETANVLMEIANERNRQIDYHGYTAESDDSYQKRELLGGAIAYMLASNPKDAICSLGSYTMGIVKGYCLPKVWNHPPTGRKALIQAAALLIAEIERLDRKKSI